MKSLYCYARYDFSLCNSFVCVCVCVCEKSIFVTVYLYYLHFLRSASYSLV